MRIFVELGCSQITARKVLYQIPMNRSGISELSERRDTGSDQEDLVLHATFSSETRNGDEYTQIDNHHLPRNALTFCDVGGVMDSTTGL